ncbi:AAA family ATPase [Paenibacillus glufosinatiresistens]|uniref:AAA family ATPase n=1 Tax=Paenibacillus glufosinatiresistens TaxID=3070657 RepID=UPI00286E089B|nr:AAA family ATPase [Paenibacillus sp. YX.27]
MRLLLIAGGYGSVARQYITSSTELINEEPLTLAEAIGYIAESPLRPDGVLITEEALTLAAERDRRDLESLVAGLAAILPAPVPVVVLTGDGWRPREWEGLLARCPQIRVEAGDYIRMTPGLLARGIELAASTPQRSAAKGKNSTSEPALPLNAAQHAGSRPTGEPAAPRKSFLDRFRSKSKERHTLEPTDALTRELNRISRGISRVVAVTGHRGSGVTSTAVNLASEAGRRGLSALIVDLDMDYRSTNMYFGSFHETTKRDDDINASLIRTLARPQDFAATAYPIKENVWLTGLGYGFDDARLIGQFVTEARLTALLSLMRNRFNLIVLDLPLDLLGKYTEIMIHIDSFGLCVPNDLYSVLSTLRNVENKLPKEQVAYLNAKSKLVVTRYNDRSRFQGEMFTPDAVARVLTSGLMDGFTYEMKVAGHVPYSSEFDSQIESDVPLVYTSAHYERAYGNILLRLLEGTG